MGTENVATQAAVRGALTPRMVEERNIRSLYAEIAWQGIIAAGIGSYIGVFLARLGASNLWVGMLTALPSLVAIVVTVPAASLVEGRRDLIRITNLSRLASWSCFLLIALVPVVFSGGLGAWAPAVVVILWAATALFGAPSGPAFTAAFAEIVSPHRRPTVNGTRWALQAGVIALFVTPFGRALDAIPFPLNYQVIFALSFVAALGSIYFFGRLRMPHEPDAAAPVRVHLFKQLLHLPRTIREQPPFARYLGGMMVFRLGLWLPVALSPVFWVRELQSSDSWIGYATTATYATLVCAYWLWGRLSSRLNHSRMLLICCGGLILPPAMTFLVPSPPWMLPVAVVGGFFSGGFSIALFEAFMEACPRKKRATFAGIDGVVVNLAASTMPLVGTKLADVIGIRPVFALAAGIILLGVILMYFITGTSRQSAEPPPEPAPVIATPGGAEANG